ncbi:alanine racemase [candidate division KSB1 bacterium]|nr:alanine racemase [Candidatus Aminicenantes bacterium]RQW03648.1 MAG: alanine racemase [candidate division KSB1 bacterium]
MKTHIELNKANLLHNLKVFKEITRRKIMFVVKANAYGHGLNEIIEIIKDLPLVDYYAVDSISEAMLIKSRQQQKPILILGWSDRAELTEIIANGFETVVPSNDQFKLSKEIAKKINRKAFIHLKLETGTQRLGLEPEKVTRLLRNFPDPQLELRGIYSHFANIEDTTDPTFAQQQLAIYNQVLKHVPAGRILRHFSSSASSLLFPKTFFDMVRIGISAYGYWPSKQTHALYLEKSSKKIILKPVLSWVAKVAQIKQIKKGSAIGYGLSYRTYNNVKIIVVPVGYYDGYDRKLSNIAQILVHGVKAPIRGRICMDMFMVDVTHVKNVKIGDRVLILGEENGEKIHADVLAELAGTINYEILARINPLIPRIIV